MGWFDGWPFKSKEQIAKERRQFERRVLPFDADGQREVVLSILRQTMNQKLKDEERLFAYLTAKDKYTLDDENPEDYTAAEETLRKMRWLTGDDRLVVLALLRLERSATGPEDYPLLAEVRSEIDRLRP